MMDAARVPLAAEMPNPAVSWAYRTQAWGAALCFAAFRALPVDAASVIGGSLARWIGPALGISKRARLNLAAALPELSVAEIDNIIRGMWDNLGRIAAEYPHLRDIRVFAPGGRVETSGFEHVDRAIAEGRRIIFFSAHLANWEIAALAAGQYGMAAGRSPGPGVGVCVGRFLQLWRSPWQPRGWRLWWQGSWWDVAVS
jgi:KDO2-lipid IV(A) lauroyltransferase